MGYPIGGLLLVLLDPITGVYKCLDPRCYLVAEATIGGIVGTLPGEDGTLKVGHHSQVTAVGATDTGNTLGRTVGVGGVGVVVVACYDVVAVGRVGKFKLALAVGNPYTQLAARERAEHYRVVLGDGQADKVALELVRVVVTHARLLGVVGGEEAEFYHQLTTVADTQRQGVGT